MKYLFFFICIGIYAQDSLMVIEGKFDKNLNGKLELFDHETGFACEAKVKKGQFLIKEKSIYPKLVRIKFKGKYSSSFYIEPSELVINFTKDFTKANDHNRSSEFGKNQWRIKSYKGSTSDSLWIEYLKFQKKNKENENYKYLLYNYLENQIIEYPKSYVYLDILISFSRYNREFFNYPQLIELLKKIKIKSKDEVYNRNLVNGIATTKYLSIGSKFPINKLNNILNSNIESSFSEHKYTIIHFWTPSHDSKLNDKRNSNLENYYQVYHTRGLNIVSIARVSYLKFSSHFTDQFLWPSYISDKLKNRFFNPYLFYLYILDNNGYIVKVNPNFEELDEFFKKNFY